MENLDPDFADLFEEPDRRTKSEKFHDTRTSKRGADSAAAKQLREDAYIATLVKTGSRCEANKAVGLSPYGDGLFRSIAGRERLHARILELRKNLNITPERVLQEYARIAFADVRCIFDDNGTLIPIHELDDDTAAAVASVEVQTIGDKEGVMKTDTHKVKMYDKLNALGVLAKRLKLYEDSIKVEGSLEVNKMSKNEKTRRIAFFLQEALRKKEQEDSTAVEGST